MRYSTLLNFVLLTFLGVCGLLYTNQKLDKMEQIRGWKPGATVQLETVHQKFRDPQSNACWIALSDVSIHRSGPHRLNLDPQVWNSLQIGDQMEVVYVPGDPDPYTRDGIYANDGNFEFDRYLMIFESILIGIGLNGTLITIGAYRWPKMYATFRGLREETIKPEERE